VQVPPRLKILVQYKTSRIVILSSLRIPGIPSPTYPSSMDPVNDIQDNEQTPLLKKPQKPAYTPLPKLQIAIVLILQICEPICSMSIYPYINEVSSQLFYPPCALLIYVKLVSTLDIIGGDERKVGYYAGLIVSKQFRSLCHEIEVVS